MLGVLSKTAIVATTMLIIGLAASAMPGPAFAHGGHGAAGGSRNHFGGGFRHGGGSIAADTLFGSYGDCANPGGFPYQYYGPYGYEACN